MSRSTAPAAQTALIARLAARPALADTVVQIGLPAAVPPEYDRLYIASIDNLQRSNNAGLSAIPRIFEETYTLTTLVECELAGDDTRQTVNNRLWAMIDEIEQELARDQELADNVDEAYVEAIPSAFTVPGPSGWIGKALVHIRVVALVRLG